MFALGHRDVSRKFHIPQRIYGRELELAALQALFEQVSAGSTELCMVSGQSGGRQVGPWSMKSAKLSFTGMAT